MYSLDLLESFCPIRSHWEGIERRHKWVDNADHVQITTRSLSQTCDQTLLCGRHKRGLMPHKLTSRKDLMPRWWDLKQRLYYDEQSSNTDVRAQFLKASQVPIVWIKAKGYKKFSDMDAHVLHSCKDLLTVAGLLINTGRICRLLIWKIRATQLCAYKWCFLLGKSFEGLNICFMFTLLVSALWSTTGMFSSILLLSDASWGDVPFPTPRSLGVINNFLSGVFAHIWCNIVISFHVKQKKCHIWNGIETVNKPPFFCLYK